MHANVYEHKIFHLFSSSFALSMHFAMCVIGDKSEGYANEG